MSVHLGPSRVLFLSCHGSGDSVLYLPLTALLVSDSPLQPKRMVWSWGGVLRHSPAEHWSRGGSQDKLRSFSSSGEKKWTWLERSFPLCSHSLWFYCLGRKLLTSVVSQGHIQFKGKSDVIDSPPGCLLRQQTAFHKLINIWLTAKHVRRLVRCAHTRRKTSTFKCGAKMVDFTGCTGTYPGTRREWQSNNPRGAITVATASWEIPENCTFSTRRMGT